MTGHFKIIDSNMKRALFSAITCSLYILLIAYTVSCFYHSNEGHHHSHQHGKHYHSICKCAQSVSSYITTEPQSHSISQNIAFYKPLIDSFHHDETLEASDLIRGPPSINPSCLNLIYTCFIPVGLYYQL